jgi:eukaryotic-like serine/threonine-protein kinase
LSEDTDSISSKAGVKEGDVLAGKYRIDKILGAGGMGVVVAAHHIQLDERVAIKFLLPAALHNKEAVTRFAREARAAVKIKSEHVVRVSDVGTLETGAPYMVMEFLEGSDLSSWLANKGPLPVEQAVEFVLQACEAIAEAHALGIVHRDLKPANLFVLKRPGGSLSVKVLDFGISKVTGLGASGPDLSMTKTSSVMGSPLYMSPEQMQSSKDADARSDIWALGVILYELLTGRPPFEADAMPELVVKILTANPVPIRNLRADAPGGIERVIYKALEKDRGRRYATVGELAHDLIEFGNKRARASVERISSVLQAAGLSASALALPPSSDTATPPANATMAAWGQTSPGAMGGKRMLISAAALVVVTVIVTIAVVGRKSSSDGDIAKPTVASEPAPAAPPAAAAPAPAAAEPESAKPAAVAPAVAPAQPEPEAPATATAKASGASGKKTTATKPPASAAPKAPPPPAASAKPAPAPTPRFNAFDDRK